MQEEVVQRIRIKRIKKAQEEESRIATLKESLIGDITKLSIEESEFCYRITIDYKADEKDYWFFARDLRKIQIAAWSWFAWWYRKFCSKISCIIVMKSGGRTPRYRQNIPTNPVQVTLERTLSECPALCGRMC